MRAPLSLSAVLILSACGSASDERSVLLAEIEDCFQNAAPVGETGQKRAATAIEGCSRSMDAYSRYNVEEMFDRKVTADDSEMMEFFEIHQSELKDLAFRKLTSGEGNWQ